MRESFYGKEVQKVLIEELEPGGVYLCSNRAFCFAAFNVGGKCGYPLCD